MVIFSQCMDCKNYTGKNKDEKFCCRAFPNGIPDDVFWNKKIHNEHIENDNDILFEQIKD